MKSKIKISKNYVNRFQPNEDNIYYEYESTPNFIQNINLTFNQSIEKKRELLGIPLNIKENLNKKIEDIAKNNDKNVKKETDKKKDKKNGGELYDKNNEKNKSTKTIYDKKYISKKINIIQKNKKKMNLIDINSPTKESMYDNESYPTTYNNTNNIIYNQIFKNSNYKKNIFEAKDKNNNHIASTSSLTSLYSTQTNKSNKTDNYTLFKNNNKNYDYVTNSNCNITHITKLKKNIGNIGNKSNNNVVIKKNENKNYLNSIKVIKKIDKNTKNENKKEIYKNCNNNKNK